MPTPTKVGMLQGTSSFLVPRGTPGLTIARCNETLGGRFRTTASWCSRTARPADHLLVENDALGKAGIYFRSRKIIQASKNLGVAWRRSSAPRVRQNYVQGGRILIKHQAVALRLADMATRLAAVPLASCAKPARASNERAPTPITCQHGESVRVGGSLQGHSARDGSCMAATA